MSSINEISIVATMDNGEHVVLGGTTRIAPFGGTKVATYKLSPNTAALHDMSRLEHVQASFVCLLAFTEWFLCDPTTTTPMVVAAYRAAQREAGRPDPGAAAMFVVGELLAKIDRMPCTAKDFLGLDLYKRAATIAGRQQADTE